jgi:hypothetical protein
MTVKWMVKWNASGVATCEVCGVRKSLGSELSAAWWSVGHVRASHSG